MARAMFRPIRSASPRPMAHGATTRLPSRSAERLTAARQQPRLRRQALDGLSRIGDVPSARTPLILVNPIAGNGRAHGLTPKVEAWLAERGLEARLIETREPGHAERLAAAAADLGHDRVVAVGGDGTVQEVVNGLMTASHAPADAAPSLG